jgi:hypothetical protein
MYLLLRGSFAKFVDSPYYSESELRGGAVRSLFRSTSLGKRCISYNAPPISRKRAADRWSLWNFLSRSSLFMVGKAQKSHGARSKLNSVFDLEKVDGWNPTRTSAIQSIFRPMRFLGFSNHEKGAPRQEISKWSTVCSTFPRSGWSSVRSSSLDKGGTSKKRPSLHLHKVPTSSNKVIPRTFQTGLIHVWRDMTLKPFTQSNPGTESLYNVALFSKRCDIWSMSGPYTSEVISCIISAEVQSFH